MTAPDRTPLDYRPSAPCARCRVVCSYLDLTLGARCELCVDVELRRLSQPRHSAPERPGPVVRAVALLLSLALCGAFWAGVLLGAQAAACAVWEQSLSYCQGES